MSRSGRCAYFYRPLRIFSAAAKTLPALPLLPLRYGATGAYPGPKHPLHPAGQTARGNLAARTDGDERVLYLLRYA